MVTIILECIKSNEWEIKTEKGSVMCTRRHETTDDAVAWCKNYMTSFQFSYTIKIIEHKR
jgi:hypothetical protein